MFVLVNGCVCHSTSTYPLLSHTDAVYRDNIARGCCWLRLVDLLVGSHLVWRVVELLCRYLVIDVL